MAAPVAGQPVKEGAAGTDSTPVKPHPERIARKLSFPYKPQSLVQIPEKPLSLSLTLYLFVLELDQNSSENLFSFIVLKLITETK